MLVHVPIGATASPWMSVLPGCIFVKVATGYIRAFPTSAEAMMQTTCHDPPPLTTVATYGTASPTPIACLHWWSECTTNHRSRP